MPKSLAVANIFRVADDAHARFSAVSRTYHYRVVETKSPFLGSLTTRVARGLDFDAMNAAARLLLGRHDFASFCRVHTDVKTTFCTVSEACWEQVRWGECELWQFTITADRFLRNMVRAVVGTLFEVGRGRMTIDGFAAVIEARNRCRAGQSAPAEGLYLVRVQYPNDIFNVQNINSSVQLP